jgi:non-specific serine/threonine protein kinase
VEDKIDKLIESKKQLVGDLLGSVSDLVLTEMKDEELLKLVALDLNAATKEARG